MPTPQAGAPRGVRIVTPWFPTKDQPALGAFVAEQATAIAAQGIGVEVVHLVLEPTRRPEFRVLQQRSRGFADLQARVAADDGEGHRDGYRLWRVHVPRAAASTHRDGALAARTAYSAFASTHPLDSGAIVHAHVLHLGGYAAAGPWHPNAAMITTEHYSGLADLLASQSGRALLTPALLRSDRVVTVSESLRATLRDGFRQLGDSVTVIPNIVALPDRPAPRAGDQDAWLVVALLTRAKRVDLALRSLAEQHRRGGAARLTIVGGGPEHAELAGLAAELGIADSVRFTGQVPREEVAALMSKHGVLLHLSDHETFGITPVQAAGNGLAVVATRTKGVAETFADPDLAGRTSLLPIDPHPGEVVDAVASVVRRRPEPAAAHAAASARFGAPAVLAALVATWQSAIDRRATLPTLDEHERALLISRLRVPAEDVRATARQLSRQGTAVSIAIDRPRMLMSGKPGPFAAACISVLPEDIRRYTRLHLESKLPRPAARAIRRLRRRTKFRQKAAWAALLGVDQVGAAKSVHTFDRHSARIAEAWQGRVGTSVVLRSQGVRDGPDRGER